GWEGVGEGQEAIGGPGPPRRQDARLAPTVRVAAEKNGAAHARAHRGDGLAKPLAVPRRARGTGRPARARLSIRKIVADDRHAALGEGLAERGEEGRPRVAPGAVGPGEAACRPRRRPGEGAR